MDGDRGYQHRRAVEDSWHIYDGTDKTFFYINFGGTWSRNPVDSFATVPTQAERTGATSHGNRMILLLYNNTFQI